jgi:hypothetical protein
MKSKLHTIYKTQNKVRVPGVTTIAGLLDKSGPLMHWSWECGKAGIDYRKFSDDKAAQGTLAHNMILCHLSNESPVLDDYTKNQIDAAENSFLSYLEWERGKIIEPILLESQLVDEDLMFGGTFDFFGKIDGVPTLMDFKTGKAIYSEMEIQLSAYNELLNSKGQSATAWQILRIGRDETEGFEVRPYSSNQMETAWAIFKHLLSIYYLKKGMKG